MSEKAFRFEMPERHRSIIKVIGVGGGGSNAINHMFNQGIRDVEFVVVNTDAQALKNSPVPNCLQIGVSLTEGLGAGANPERGRDAAEESQEHIRELLGDGTKMVFITAGMGGGTGTGAAPVLARIAKEMGILTVGIVTAPFGFEGRKKRQQAELGIAELRANCDTVLVILNDKLREIYGNLVISQAFAQADNVLTTAAKGIAEIITVPGYVNVDFEDVKTVMRESGAAVMGSATTFGENRARKAAEEALASPLLNEKDIHGAQKILLSIVSGAKSELQMDELTEITEYIQGEAGDRAEMIFGHGIDDELGENIRVTVIATGFEQVVDEVIEAARRQVVDLNTRRKIEPSAPALPAPRRRRIFMDPAEPETPPTPEPSHTVLQTDTNFQIDPPEPTDEPPAHQDPQPAAEPRKQRTALEEHQHRLRVQSRERVERLRNDRPRRPLDEQALKHYDEPAYLRRKVQLDRTPHSSESNVSRYHLTEEDGLSNNNRFLHDNVD
ncbi:MAG: cell division protein FtsZ [Catalinimonas sp.]